MSQQLNLFATTPKGLELLLVEELRELGAQDPAEKLAGVSFKGDLSVAYKACLWSRLANRILLSLAKVPSATPEALYAGVQQVDWSQHLEANDTFFVHFISSQSNITHTLFGAQKVKDAIVDQMRERFGTRPSISKDRPAVSVYVYLYRNEASIYLDLSGESLHKRGYRLASGAAPLKENLAAGILLRAGWPAIAAQGGGLMDPMCGSGTLLIEGALMAADIAPGLLHDYFGFLNWKNHQPTIWQDLIKDAEARRAIGMKKLPDLVGYDQDPHAIKIAFENIDRAGLRGHIHVEKHDVAEFKPKATMTPGLVITNPPYGERLGEVEELQPLYTLLGERLKQGFTGWKAGVFTGNPELGKQMGLRASQYYTFLNGAIPCKLLLFTIQAEQFVDRSPEADNERRIRAAKRAVANLDKQSVQMFINRLQKNLKHFRKQAERQKLTHYQVYDADLPEYAFKIEVDEKGILVQEYEAPKSIDNQKVMLRRQEVLAALPEIFEVAPGKIYFSILPRRTKKSPV